MNKVYIAGLAVFISFGLCARGDEVTIADVLRANTGRPFEGKLVEKDYRCSFIIVKVGSVFNISAPATDHGREVWVGFMHYPPTNDWKIENGVIHTRQAVGMIIHFDPKTLQITWFEPANTYKDRTSLHFTCTLDGRIPKS
jgi:hypothetical protein